MESIQLNYPGRFFTEANRLNNSSVSAKALAKASAFVDCRGEFQWLRFCFIQKPQSLKFTSAVSKISHPVHNDWKIWVSFDWPSYVLYSSNPEFVKSVVAQETVMIAYAANRAEPSKQVLQLIFKKKFNLVIQQTVFWTNIIILKIQQHSFRHRSS